MAKRLTDAQIPTAKAWLHDVFVWGHMISNPRRDIPPRDYWYMYGGKNPAKRRVQGDQEACELICKVIQYRQAETKFIKAADKALEILAQCQFNPELHSTDIWKHTSKSADMLAKYIAWYCTESHPTKKFYWSTDNTSSYELESIKNETILGKALWDAEAFTCQVPGSAKTSSSNTSNTSTSAGNPPKSNFKSRGPLSGVAVDLIGQPNQKISLSGKLYCIVGKDANGKTLDDCVFVRPVEADQKIQQKYMVGNTNKVLFGAAKGYGFCPCFFTSLDDAKNFYSKINFNNFKLNQKVDTITIEYKKAQANGYFQVGTEFGPVYISAEKLNESLQEDVKKDEVDITPTADELKGNFAGLTFEEYDNAFHRG